MLDKQLRNAKTSPPDADGGHGESGRLDVRAEWTLESLSSGILAVDLECRVLYLNASLARRLGVDGTSWSGMAAQKLFEPVCQEVAPLRAPLYRLDLERNRERTGSREVEWSDRRRISHFREDSAPLRDATGEIVGRVFAYHDLSWEKTIDQMKSEFISIASHELRTPMTSIKGALELILGGAVGEVASEARELLDVAQASCDRMIRLINNILDLSKIEANQVQLQLTSVELGDAIESVLRNLKTLAAQDNISLRFERAGRVPAIIGDRDRLEQVITNLVSNAIKFSPDGGIVEVKLSAKDGWVTCAVSDQGPGIEEKNLERIFGKFQQVGAARRGSGTGLGLAITQALIKEHKGKIWVESQLDKGSRFSFSLPVRGLERRQDSHRASRETS